MPSLSTLVWRLFFFFFLPWGWVPKDRAILWAESDSWPVRSSEPCRCTPQGRTTDSIIMTDSQGRWPPHRDTHDSTHFRHTEDAVKHYKPGTHTQHWPTRPPLDQAVRGAWDREVNDTSSGVRAVFSPRLRVKDATAARKTHTVALLGIQLQ